MSLTSNYEIDLSIQDNTKDAIRQVQTKLRELGKEFKPDETEKQVEAIIKKLRSLAQNTDLDINAVGKSFNKGTRELLDDLELQGVNLREQLEKAKVESKGLERQIESISKTMTYSDKSTGSERIKSQQDIKSKMLEISRLKEKQQALNIKQLESDIEHNKQLRLNLKTATQQAKIDAVKAKLEAAENKAWRGALRDKAKYLIYERKENNILIKQLREQLELLQHTEKQQKAITKAIKESEKAESRFSKILKKANNAIQTTYNVTGMVGGVGRTLKAGGAAIAGITRDAMTAADDETKKEKEARRIKGFENEDAMNILNELYFQTGSDYSVIVDAINRVQSVLKTTNKTELIEGTKIELSNPGMILAFASSKTDPSLQMFNAYDRMMTAIQKTTGASAEQVQASAQKMANYDLGGLANTSMTELQAIYLGLQNSGAFETQDELDKAFDKFVNSRKNSQKLAWEDAKSYDWTKYISNERNYAQAKNTLKNMDWESIGDATGVIDTLPKQPTTMESTAEQMRRIEYQKNQILVKLLPAVAPLFERLAQLLSSDKGKKVIDGIMNFISTAVPILTDVILKIAERLGVIIKNSIEATTEMSNRRIEMHGAPPWMANGGLALGPSIVGERGPEAIIPLDYSRTARAGNIVQNVAQTFNMSGNETTALSLAQAVSSRDFTRAMGKAAFKAGRLGAF